MGLTVLVEVSDPDDPRLAVFLGLRDHSGRQRRERAGGDMAAWFMAEGATVIARAARAGRSPLSVLCAPRSADQLADVVAADVPVYVAGPAVLRAVSGRPDLRDPIACFARQPMPEVEQLLAAARTVAVLEGIVNPTNMGVICRCAAALGVDAVLVDPTSCDPLYRRAVRVSMGEVFAVPHARIGPLPGALVPIRDAGFVVVALTPSEDALDIASYRRGPGQRLAVVLGTEGPGLTPGTMAACDVAVRIAMSAGVDSINVGSAAAVAFHALRPAGY